jgi:uncharacterized protein YjbJ (UPF0337 family)
MNSNRPKGAGREAAGVVKELVGKLTGDKTLEAQGEAMKAEGKAQNAVGKIEDAVEDALK